MSEEPKPMWKSVDQIISQYRKPPLVLSKTDKAAFLLHVSGVYEIIFWNDTKKTWKGAMVVNSITPEAIEDAKTRVAEQGGDTTGLVFSESR